MDLLEQILAVLTHRLDSLSDAPGIGLGSSQFKGQLLHSFEGHVRAVLKCLDVISIIYS